MRRHIMLAAMILPIASISAAEPAAEVREQHAPAASETPTALASVADVRVPAAERRTSEVPAKRPRIARVTTCRCGDVPNR